MTDFDWSSAPEYNDEPDDDMDECYECGGEMWIVADCDEDTCPCADPETQHRLIPCLSCNPKGKL